MIKVTLARSYSGKNWWKVNRKAKGSFTREFEDISDLATYLSKTRRIWLPKVRKELTKDQLVSLHRKLSSLEGRFRFIPNFPDEESLVRSTRRYYECT